MIDSPRAWRDAETREPIIQATLQHVSTDIKAVMADPAAGLRHALVTAAGAWMRLLTVTDLKSPRNIAPLEILLAALHDASPPVRATARGCLGQLSPGSQWAEAEAGPGAAADGGYREVGQRGNATRADREHGGDASAYGMLLLQSACENILKGVAGDQGLCSPSSPQRLVAVKILHGLVTSLWPPHRLDLSASPSSVDTSPASPRSTLPSAWQLQYADEILAVSVHALHPAWGGAWDRFASQDSQDDDDSSADHEWGRMGREGEEGQSEIDLADGCDGPGSDGSDGDAACGLGLWSQEGRWHVCETIKVVVSIVPLRDALAVCERHFLGAGATDEHNEPLDSPSHR